MKRYLLFCFEHYYPCGGWNDFVADGDTIEELLAIRETKEGDYFNIVDTQTKKIVMGHDSNDP